MLMFQCNFFQQRGAIVGRHLLNTPLLIKYRYHNIGVVSKSPHLCCYLPHWRPVIELQSVTSRSKPTTA